jgi:trans-aconitate methyltransferase
MDDEAQAEAYATTDFSEPHQAFVTHFTERFPDFSGGEVMDLGCGPADITVRFALAYPDARITGMDGAAAMLACGRSLVRQRGLDDRVVLRELLLPCAGFPDRRHDAVISNSLLHHLDDPAVQWQAAAACAAPGAPIFVMDLYRPETTSCARALVDQHAEGADELLRQDFYNSLLAAYREPEVRAQLDAAGLSHLTVELVSDRHLIVWGRS